MRRGGTPAARISDQARGEAATGPCCEVQYPKVASALTTLPVAVGRVIYAAVRSKLDPTAAQRPRQIAKAPAETAAHKAVPKLTTKAGAEFPPLPTPTTLPGLFTSVLPNDDGQVVGEKKRSKKAT